MNRNEAVARLASLHSDLASGADLSMVGESLVELSQGLSDKQLTLEADDVPIAQAPEPESAVIGRVFNYWREKTGKPRARLLVERVRRISARLRQFSEAELCTAIDGALLSDFHTGANGGEEYLSLSTIFKNGEAVEKHIERAGGVPTNVSYDASPRAAQAKQLKSEAREAMEEGRMADYNRINEKLKELLHG